MKINILTIFLVMNFITGISQTLPQVSVGRLERIENFNSKFVTPRHIDVWLPDGYNDKQKYDVLYMHDGQMLFDAQITWTKQSWEVDSTASLLMHKGKVNNFIVVGIWNGETTRHADYFPQKPYESLSTEQKDYITKQLQQSARTTDSFNPCSDNYLKFLVTELKPLIDSKYSVHKQREHTFIAGSSMGGLISMYAICEYPDVFGGAACLSTHWPGIFTLDNNPCPDTFANYMNMHLPDPKTHRIYFDYGDQTLDSLYPALQKKVDDVMRAKGFTSKNWETVFFSGKDHTESSWRDRLDVPLLFLLQKK